MDRMRIGAKTSLLAFGAILAIQCYLAPVLAGDVTHASTSTSRVLQQCLADYLIDRHDHPGDDYYHGILEIEANNKNPDKYDISLYFGSSKNNKTRLNDVIEKILDLYVQIGP